MTEDRDHILRQLVRPHAKGLIVGVVAVLLEGAANLAEPWPLKIVLDSVLKSRPGKGWLNDLIFTVAGPDKYAILTLAAASVLIIAAIGAVCAYTEKYLTTTVGQYVMHDLRQRLYSHIQQLSLDYHDKQRTGDLIGCLTGDIEAIQSFITSGLLGALVNSLTLLGMIAVCALELAIHAGRALRGSAPVRRRLPLHPAHQAASREVRKKEGEMVSVIQEVLSSTRVVKALRARIMSSGGWRTRAWNRSRSRFGSAA